MKLETLYKRSLDGIEMWKVEVDFNHITTTWGKHNGKQQSRKTVIKEGKNIGKSNETSIYLQAEKNAKSAWQKKVDREGYYSIQMLGYKPEIVNPIEGFTHKKIPIALVSEYYFPLNGKDELAVKNVLTLAEVLKRLPEIGSTNEGNTLPMLAKSYYRETKNGDVPRLSYPHLIQPKFNGVRALLKITQDSVSFWSREGKEYKVAHLSELIKNQLSHIAQWYQNIFQEDLEELILDGELYIHNTILADIVSAVKKPNLNTASLKFHCYDLAVLNIPQTTRLKYLKSLDVEGIERVETLKVTGEHTVLAMLDRYISQGYEGLIGRHMNGLYQFGARSLDLVKLKKIKSGEFKIVDVFDTPKQPGLAMFRCMNDINMQFFDVTPQGDRARKAQYLEDRLEIIGKYLTVEYYERTDAPKSLPFHATGVAIRDYE